MKIFTLIAAALLSCSAAMAQTATYYSLKKIPGSEGPEFRNEKYEIFSKEKIFRTTYGRGYENQGILSSKTVGKKQALSLAYMSEGGGVDETPSATAEIEDTPGGKILKMIDSGNKLVLFATYIGTQEQQRATQNTSQPAAKPAESKPQSASQPAAPPESKPAQPAPESQPKSIKESIKGIFKK